MCRGAHIYECVYVWVNMLVCMHVHVYEGIHMHMCMKGIHVYVCVCGYKCTCCDTHIYLSMCVDAHIGGICMCMHVVHMYICVYMCMSAYVHVCLCIWMHM